MSAAQNGQTTTDAILRPLPTLVRLTWALTGLAVATAFFSPLLPVLAVAALLLAVLAITDVLLARFTPVPDVARTLTHAFALGQWHEASLSISPAGKRQLFCTVFDLHPPAADSTGMPATVTLTANSQARIDYRLRFNERGDFVFPGIALRYAGPLGLAACQRIVGEPFRVRVYPDFAAVARYALLAVDNKLSQMGIRHRQRRGEGLEFRQLRTYRPGDALRQIDWKATSRLRKLVSREYQDERDQQVMFLLDCGFRMRSQDGGISHFDAALNAMLLLSWVVLRQGDAAGCLTFAGDERDFAPAKGKSSMSRLMNGLFDLQPTSRTPDFRALAIQCATRIRKRSLLVLMTNVRDEDTDDLIAAGKLLGERHLVLVATLRETVIDEMHAAPPQNEDEALRSASAHLFLADRERALQRLVSAGLLVLDCTPGQLPVRLINTYLDIKRSGRL